MSKAFIYDRYVTGKYFVGRKDDCAAIENLLAAGQHLWIAEPPKSGKSSLIQQALFNLRIKTRHFIATDINLLDVRDTETFITKFGSAVIRAVASTPDEFETIAQKYLQGTHIVFDRLHFSRTDEVLSMNWSAEAADIEAIIRLPWFLASEQRQAFHVIIDEFQNLDFCEDSDMIYKAMERVLNEMILQGRRQCTLVLCGSRVNAMESIFKTRRFFYRKVDRFSLRPINEKDIVESVVKGFLSSGKVVDRDLLSSVCQTLGFNPWYINHFAAICDSLSKGYIMETTITEALEGLVAIHDPRFRGIMSSLTTFQVGLLKAILQGHKRFSSSEVINNYHLQSSANVKRLKEALMKKEILAFDDMDSPFILDPLFRYWACRYYFCLPENPLA